MRRKTKEACFAIFTAHANNGTRVEKDSEKCEKSEKIKKKKKRKETPEIFVERVQKDEKTTRIDDPNIQSHVFYFPNFSSHDLSKGVKEIVALM